MNPYPEQDLHPIIDDLLDTIRKRTEEIDGRRVVVEEFVLLPDSIPPLEEKMRVIPEEEQREAMLSIMAFSMMVEKQGYHDNAQKIRNLCKVYGDKYVQLEQLIAARLVQRTKEETKGLFQDSTPQNPLPEISDDSSNEDIDDDLDMSFI